MRWPTRKKERYRPDEDGPCIGWWFQVSLDDHHIANIILDRELDASLAPGDLEDYIWERMEYQLFQYISERYELEKVRANLEVSANCRERYSEYRKEKFKLAYRRKENLD